MPSKLVSIKHKRVFDRLFKKGNKLFTPLYVLRWSTNLPSLSTKMCSQQISFVISKKQVKTAVKRNFIKRRSRSAMRVLLNSFPIPDGAYVLLLNYRVGTVPFPELVKQLSVSFKKVNDIVSNEVCES